MGTVGQYGANKLKRFTAPAYCMKVVKDATDPNNAPNADVYASAIGGDPTWNPRLAGRNDGTTDPNVANSESKKNAQKLKHDPPPFWRGSKLSSPPSPEAVKAVFEKMGDKCQYMYHFRTGYDMEGREVLVFRPSTIPFKVFDKNAKWGDEHGRNFANWDPKKKKFAEQVNRKLMRKKRKMEEICAIHFPCSKTGGWREDFSSVPANIILSIT